MSRKKVVLLSLVVVCVIGTITALVVNQREEPKNVFEEMYYAEMDAAKLNASLAEGQTKQKTPLSNTEYFDETIAAIDYDGGESTSSTVKELPKEGSPYTLLVADLTHRYTTPPFSFPFEKGYDLMQKIVKIENRFLYHDTDIIIEYWYTLFSDGYDSFDKKPKKEGLSISVKSVINVLNYWIDNYPQSKFSRDDFGMYEIEEQS
jgi:hypothetical protein